MRASISAAIGVATTLLVLPTLAQVVTYTGTSELQFLTGTKSPSTSPTGPPSGIYVTYESRITLVGPNTTATINPSLFPTPSNATTTAATPTNTQPCNNYLEFCTRKYSNITFVAAHNSPFVRPGNSGSNQAIRVKGQLEDGIRLVQGQMHWPTNGTEPHFCHSSCDLLDAGPITEWLTEVREWVDEHPYDVVTILLGNGNYSDASLYAPYIEQSKITKYAYTPSVRPMKLDDWPTLEEMIVRGQRVVMFMDYNANPEEYPWLLDEFSQMWETPFDPQSREFPCTIQRPPDLSNESARNDMLYLMNHNLNAEFNVFNVELLVPAVSLINETNADAGFGSLGLSTNSCRSDWGRPPNFINVDYYNYGNYPGSVFVAAARVNNVTYPNGTCCNAEAFAAPTLRISTWTVAGALLLALYLNF